MLITEQTGVAGADLIIAGTDLCAILKSMPASRFQKNQQPKGKGPFVLGVLDGTYKVIQNPGYDSDTAVMLQTGGGNYLDCAFVFAPYMPFKVVGPQTYVDDMKSRVGVMTSNALQVVNAGLGVDITVTSS